MCLRIKLQPGPVLMMPQLVVPARAVQKWRKTKAVQQIRLIQQISQEILSKSQIKTQIKIAKKSGRAATTTIIKGGKITIKAKAIE